ncbi:trypco2 family protein [Streptomyces sp. NPDC017979]|uniref:trypco2 family protein n=1 Tax=Streptomyces sp. NPDC017979 TaxID=3365024 RepID=UPI0037B1BEFF
MTDEVPGVPLATWIQALRTELQNAQQAGANAALNFRVGDVELELDLATTEGRDGKAGVRFWVLDVGAAATRQSVATQRVRITLTPLGTPDARGDRSVEVGEGQRARLES